MALPWNLDGDRAIVIEDVPAGTGIADLIGAFSAYGPIRFATVGPPAVVSFETEASAAHAVLVASMKSVSLLGASREKKLHVPAQPAASRSHPSPSSALPPPPLGVSTETEIGSNEASPAEVSASQTQVSPIEAAPPAEAVAADTKTSKVQVQPAVREKKLQVPSPAPAQPATCCNHRPYGASMASASDSTDIGSITGRLNPAPREERRVPLLRSVASSVATLTEDEYYYKIIRAFLGSFFFFSFLIIPIFTVPEVFP